MHWFAYSRRSFGTLAGMSLLNFSFPPCMWCEHMFNVQQRRQRGRAGKGSAQDTGESIESGGPAAPELNPSNSSYSSGDTAVSRRRSGDSSSIVPVSGSGTLGRVVSMEMTGLLSGTNDAQ